MRFNAIFAAAAFGNLVASVALPQEGNVAVAFGRRDAPLKLTRSTISRRGDEWKGDDALTALEGQSASATQDQIMQSINYLVNIFNQKGIQYGLMGGVAMQLLGYTDRTTSDSDMAVSVKVKDLLDAVQDDPQITRPGKMDAQGGTARMFINIGGQQVESDVMYQGGFFESSPSLDGLQQLGGYNVVSIAQLMKGKLQRLEDKDVSDLIWLIENKNSDVQAAADGLKDNDREDFAQKIKDEQPDKLDEVCAALHVDADDLD